MAHQETLPYKRQSQDLSGGIIPTPRRESVGMIVDEKKNPTPSIDSGDSDEVTEEEKRTLRRIGDKLPKAAFLVAIIELCERFAYYGLSGPFQNYIQNPRVGPRPGAIGYGQDRATGLNLFFSFFCYVTPIGGAIVADQYLGKYWTIFYSALVYIAGLLILVLTSLPVAINNGAALGGIITAMIVIGIGTGGIKSNVSPLIAEQYQVKKMSIRTLKSGERVIVDPAITVQRIYMIFYLCINIGGLSAIATTEMELHIDFWAAYLLPACMFLVGFVVLVVFKGNYIVRPPKGSVVLHAFQAIWIGIKNRGNLEAAKSTNSTIPHPWNDLFIDELKRALVACRVFLIFPFYWVTYAQLTTNLVSQAGQMSLHGIPNDIMQNWDPLSIIIFVPIFDRIVYPLLRRFGIKFRPINRIVWGLYFGGLAMAYAAIVQHLIYRTGPCYSAPLSDTCDSPNNIHVAIQTPAYVFMGISEIFASITGLEYAYSKAPPSMKSFVMSLFLFTNALGSALGEALVPVTKDPKLTWMYTGLAVTAVIAGMVCWLLFHKYNELEEEMNALDLRDDQVAVRVDEATEGGLLGSLTGRRASVANKTA